MQPQSESSGFLIGISKTANALNLYFALRGNVYLTLNHYYIYRNKSIEWSKVVSVLVSYTLHTYPIKPRHWDKSYIKPWNLRSPTENSMWTVCQVHLYTMEWSGVCQNYYSRELFSNFHSIPQKSILKQYNDPNLLLLFVIICILL